MNSRRIALAAIVLAACGCKRSELASGPSAHGSGSESISRKEIAKLALSCSPQSRAELVNVAGSTAAPELRCEAMKPLAELAPGPMESLLPFTLKGIDSLSRSPVRDALLRMLADRDAWCEINGGFLFGDQPTKVSPAQIALWVLSEFPVPSLQSEVEKTPAGLRERAVALEQYASIAKHRDTAALAYVDGFTADASAAGFQQLAQFVADGYPWPASIQPVSDEDKSHVHAHVLAALEWLRLLASQQTGDVRYPLDCVQDLKTALRSGRLGEVLLSHFDKYDDEVRVSIMKIFTFCAREGSRPELERIAAKDPDAKVRDAADHALMVVDRGGVSALPVPLPAPGDGSASP